MRKIGLILSSITAALLALNSPSSGDLQGKFGLQVKGRTEGHEWRINRYEPELIEDGPKIDARVIDKIRLTYPFGAVYQTKSGFRYGGVIGLGVVGDEVKVRNTETDWKWEDKSNVRWLGFGFGLNGILGQDFKYFTLDGGAGIRRGFKGLTPYGTLEFLSHFCINDFKGDGVKLGIGREFSREGPLYYFTITAPLE